jgi:DNA-directed RNA polymerase
MNGILRDEFVRMHSDDIVKRLAAEFDVRYGKHMYLARVPKNSKIGLALREHRKGGGYTLTGELVAEHKRQQLLNSDDREMQAQGREMVTPAALFEKLGGTDDDLHIPQSLGRSSAHGSEDLEAAKKELGESDETDSLVDNLLTGDFDNANSLAAEAGVEDVADLEEHAVPKKKSQAATGSTYWMWMPMRFREVPKKGAWDLTRIRDSEYFFS